MFPLSYSLFLLTTSPPLPLHRLLRVHHIASHPITTYHTAQHQTAPHSTAQHSTARHGLAWHCIMHAIPSMTSSADGSFVQWSGVEWSGLFMFRHRQVNRGRDKLSRCSVHSSVMVSIRLTLTYLASTAGSSFMVTSLLSS
mmetsp:Transcript_38609/g.62547  ORF Transcript_38609/g.62547 Transcript_38609/m.62547 type:complete len:141 (-) Transcript_38609:66-488(-)